MRYQVIAYDYRGNQTKLIEAHTSHNAQMYFNVEMGKLTRSHGYAVYNYTDIVLVDTEKKTTLDSYEFDVTYIEDSDAYLLYDATLDTENEPVTIVGKSYRTSDALRCTDPIAYFGGYHLWLEAEKLVVV